MPCPHSKTNIVADRTPSITPLSDDASCSQCAAEKKQQRIYRWKIAVSLCFPAFLSAVDSTITAPALPTIASHFGRLSSQSNWIATAYTLTSTAFIPTFGQFADIYGRHFAMQLSLGFVLLGSTLSAAAQTWVTLLFGRAFQGVGSAGIYVLMDIIIADNVSLEENAKTNSIFSFIYGVAFAVGPVIGGYLTQSNWRYCFVLAIPITVVAQLIVFFVARPELKPGRYSSRGKNWKGYLAGLGTVDSVGTLLFIFGIGLIILAVSWAGLPYAWNSAPVLVPLILGAVSFVAFFVYEREFEPGRMVARLLPNQVPMIPWALFERTDTILLGIVQFACGTAIYSAFYFVSIYWNLAQGLSPSKAGQQLLFYIPGLGAGVYLAMFMCNKWPRQTFVPLFFGSIIEAVGISLIAWAVTTGRRPLVNGMMALSGVGSGIRLMPNNLHAAGIWPTRLAAAMSLLNICTPFGGTISLGMMGSVFTNKFSAGIADVARAAGVSGVDVGSAESLEAIHRLPPVIQAQIRAAASDAIMWAFISIIPIMVLSVIAAGMLGNVWVLPSKEKNGSEMQGEPSDGSVLHSSYLVALATGTVNEKKQNIVIPMELKDASEKMKHRGNRSSKLGADVDFERRDLNSPSPPIARSA